MEHSLKQERDLQFSKEKTSIYIRKKYPDFEYKHISFSIFEKIIITRSDVWNDRNNDQFYLLFEFFRESYNMIIYQQLEYVK
jgi:hypothetical protein